MILCDEWTEAQVKAFRLMVNRSVTWADWDEELLALELQELQGVGLRSQPHRLRPKEIDDLLRPPTMTSEAECRAAAAREPGVAARAICGSAAIDAINIASCAATQPDSEAVARLLGDRKPFLMVTDPPYGIAARFRMA